MELPKPLVGDEAKDAFVHALSIGLRLGSLFVLGADNLGRDAAVRLLYGGRNSLEIGVIATLITMFFEVSCGRNVRSFEWMKPGEISGVVETKFGYHVIKLTAKTAAGTRTLEEVRPSLSGDLAERKAGAAYSNVIL